MANVATLAEIKSILNIKDITEDNEITLLIPVVQNDLFVYLNNDFGGTYPAGVKLYFALMIGSKLTKVRNRGVSDTMGGFSVPYDLIHLINGYPESIMKSLTKWRKFKW